MIPQNRKLEKTEHGGRKQASGQEGVTRSKAMVIWAFRTDLSQHLPHPDTLWKWNEPDLSPRVKQRLIDPSNNEGLIVRVDGGWWRTTQQLWRYVRSKYGTGSGVREGQLMLPGYVSESLNSGDSPRYLVSAREQRERRRETQSRQVTLTGDVVDTRDLTAVERNRAKDPTTDYDPADDPAQTTLYAALTPPDWTMVIEHDNHMFAVSSRSVYSGRQRLRA